MTEKDIFDFKPKEISNLKQSDIFEAVNVINKSIKPVIILGGGSRSAKRETKKLIETLNAPTISTVNARDILGQHFLHVPASPSLKCVRTLLKGADLVIALGTEMGQTDFDMYEDGFFPTLKKIVRVDIDSDQLKKSPPGTLAINSGINAFCIEALKYLKPKQNDFSREIVKICKSSSQYEVPSHYEPCKLLLSMIVKKLPDAVMVGDSTQPTYYGNLYTDLTHNNRWFNSSTGFGTLGYALPASIGAKLANPEKPVICIIGDGGLQFSLAELGTVVDEAVPVLFLIWNNSEYKEIRTYMESKSITPLGVSPRPPNLELIAKSYKIEFKRVKSALKLSYILSEFSKNSPPMFVEVIENGFNN